MDPTTITRRPGRPRAHQTLDVALSRPFDLPAERLLPWEEELVVAPLTRLHGPRLGTPAEDPAPPPSPGDLAPFGFRTLSPMATGRRFVIDPGEAAIVSELVQLYITESGAQAVARALNLAGRRMRDGQPWDKAEVLAVLAVSAPSIVTPATYELARRLRHERDPSGDPGRAATRPQLLAGLLSCGRCDDSYQLETATKRVAGAVYRYAYYQCRSAARRGVATCRGQRIATVVLDQAILNVVRERVCRPPRVAAFAAAQGWEPEAVAKSLADLLDVPGPVARSYVLHLVEQAVVFEHRVTVLPRTECRFHGESHPARDSPPAVSPTSV